MLDADRASHLLFGNGYTKMKKLAWFALLLELSPLLAFVCLAFLHPVGDPQESPMFLVRMLDFQATYWMRNAIPVPPPLLLAGCLVSGFLWWRYRFAIALAGTIVGIVLMSLWSLVMIVPLLVHVN